jgi:hypothetical protein
MKDYYSCTFPNFGYAAAKLTEKEMESILAEVNEIQSDFSKAKPMQEGLVGNLQHEYAIIKNRDLLEHMARQLILGFAQSFNYKIRPDMEYTLDRPWVNFQRKHEFNPLHNHSGNFSFVLWVKIPYTVEEEKKYTNYVLEDRNVAGSFSFQYIDILGGLTPWNIPTDKSFEGTMILFPALLNHTVYPFFSSDEYRISISGNMAVRAGDSEASRISFS